MVEGEDSCVWFMGELDHYIGGRRNGQLSHYSYSVLTFRDRVRGILPMDRDTNGTLGSLLCMGEVSRDRDTYRFLGRGKWLG